MSELCKHCDVRNELTVQHNWVASRYIKTEEPATAGKEGYNGIPTLKNIIGRALPRIGRYKQLDNTKEVVALIAYAWFDNVRFLFKLKF